jgi:predicted negative regulator of RcsB-dependent stress response
MLNASNLYAQLLVFSGDNSTSEDSAGQVQTLANELITGHSGSVYASLAALVLARQAVEQGELDAARVQLQWALDHADSVEIGHTARIRLIRVLIDQAMYDEAASRLDAVQEPGAYAHRYSELRGDLEAARGQPAAAAQAYRQALDQLPAGAPNLVVLTAKYESVGGGGDTP